MTLYLNNDNNKFDIKLYIKECHSGKILNFNACVPNYMKYGVVVGEYRRALHRANNNDNIISSLYMVCNRFVNNEYPVHFLIQCMRKFINKLNNNNNQDAIEPVNKANIFIKMPFINNYFTNQLNRITRKLKLNNTVKFYYKTKNLTNIFLKKEKLLCNTDCFYCTLAKSINICYSKFTVYIIECTLCNKVYVGETERILKRRVEEHFTNSNSAVYHSANYVNCTPDKKFMDDIVCQKLHLCTPKNIKFVVQHLL